jgi:hypothetical protein
MGRGGYNGGSPVLNNPKEDSVYILPLHEAHFEIPNNFQILKAGEGLRTVQGGIQAEFGYIIGTKAENAKLDADSKLTPQSFTLCTLRCKKSKKSKSKPAYRWIAASVLLEHAPGLVQEYHLQHPTAPKPYGFNVKQWL